ncbi:hypothetical protein HA066_22535, partial [Escherichia coli]|nr:hypothetical protein [Escherichia coli]
MVERNATRTTAWSNWAGNQRDQATAALRPSSVDEMAEQLRRAAATARRITDGLPFKVLFPVEVRFTAGDRIWLSHATGLGG